MHSLCKLWYPKDWKLACIRGTKVILCNTLWCLHPQNPIDLFVCNHFALVSDHSPYVWGCWLERLGAKSPMSMALFIQPQSLSGPRHTTLPVKATGRRHVPVSVLPGRSKWASCRWKRVAVCGGLEVWKITATFHTFSSVVFFISLSLKLVNVVDSH